MGRGDAARDALEPPLLAPDDAPWARRIRITRGVTIEMALFVLITLSSPLTLPLAAVVDLALWLRRRKPWMSVRVVLLLWWLALGELHSLVGIARVWAISGGPLARDTPARRRRTFELQVRWATRHLAGLRRLCRVHVQVENDESLGTGPMIVFTRHASVIDNGLPALLISRAHGIDLRYVLKSQLQSLPTLDIGARWVPTCFVRRGSADPAREIERVASLARDLSGPRDGVLVFPEGTRYTPAKLARLKQRPDIGDAALAQLIGELRHVLPPRLGGPLALLDAAPQAAVVICAHTGLDRFHDLRAIWSGEVVGTIVRVRFWRHEANALPTGAEARAVWLYQRWRELDEWVAGNSCAEPASTASTTGCPEPATTATDNV